MVLTHKHTHSRLTALCQGLPGWAGTGRNIHPLTPILIIRHAGDELPPSRGLKGCIIFTGGHS